MNGKLENLWLSEKHFVHVFFFLVAVIYSIPFNLVVAAFCVYDSQCMSSLDDYVHRFMCFFLFEFFLLSNMRTKPKLAEKKGRIECNDAFRKNQVQFSGKHMFKCARLIQLCNFLKTIQAIHVTKLALESMFVVVQRG